MKVAIHYLPILSIMLLQAPVEASTVAVVDFGDNKGTFTNGNTFLTPPAGGGSSGTYTGDDAKVANIVDQNGTSTGWTLETTGLRWDASPGSKAFADTVWDNGTAMSDLTTSLGTTPSDFYSCWGDNALIGMDGKTTLTLSGLTVGQTYTISLGIGRGDAGFSQTPGHNFKIDLSAGTASSGKYALNSMGTWNSLTNLDQTLTFNQAGANAAIVQWELTPDADGKISFDFYSSQVKSYQGLDFLTIQQVPEPASAILLLGGMMVLPFRRKR